MAAARLKTDSNSGQRLGFVFEELRAWREREDGSPSSRRVKSSLVVRDGEEGEFLPAWRDVKQGLSAWMVWGGIVNLFLAGNTCLESLRAAEAVLVIKHL